MAEPRPSHEGEFDTIGRIRAATRHLPGTRIGIGDDCASLAWPEAAELLVTTDMLMDGRHFRVGEATAEEIGHKCLAVNLSDIAAMAGTPVAAVVAVALPQRGGQEIARGLHAGMSALAQEFQVDLVGGDTNAWDGPLVVCVTVLGRATGPHPVRRSGGRAGDPIFVTGPLGGSLLGRHLRPRPRIREAIALHARFKITAMIDLSDGLASDLGHILEESGVSGAVLDPARVPIHDDAHRRADQTGRTPFDHALTDGEDFELCFTLDPAELARLEPFKQAEARYRIEPTAGDPLAPAIDLYLIGRLDQGVGLRLLDSGGGPEVTWSQKGFDHFLTPDVP